MIVAVILIAIAAAGKGASNGSSNSSGDSASQSQDSANSSAASDSSASDSSTKIDADKFAKIESGMTYDQVKEIIGSDGTEQSTSAVGNTTTTIYEWDSDSFGVATVTFQNDKVVNKAQAGVGNKSTGTATMDKYNQVQTGMSYDQVKEIMGGDGELAFVAHEQVGNCFLEGSFVPMALLACLYVAQEARGERRRVH
jgi:hypothetical protein